MDIKHGLKKYGFHFLYVINVLILFIYLILYMLSNSNYIDSDYKPDESSISIFIFNVIVGAIILVLNRPSKDQHLEK